jgi:hypothetical protein
VGVETLPSEMQRATVVTGLMQMAVDIPTPAETAMVDNPMTADQHGDLIPGCPQDLRLSLVSIITTTIILMTAGDQMDARGTGLGLMIWIAVPLPKGTGHPLGLMSTHTYPATARTVGEAREKSALEKIALEKIALEMNAPEMTAEDGMIEIEIG